MSKSTFMIILSRLVKTILKLCEWLVVAISALMISVTLAQVVFRYIIGSPLTWSEELARYCFVWIVYLGAPIALHRTQHIGVDNLTIHLSEKTRRVLEVVNDVFAIALVLVIGFASFEVIDVNRLQFSPALGLQMAVVYFAIPLCMGIMGLFLIAKLLGLKGSSHTSQTL